MVDNPLYNKCEVIFVEQNEVTYNNLFTIEERKKIIAQAMRDLRKRSGKSQKQIAAKIGISQATYSAYERGRNEPPAEPMKLT